VRLWTFWQISSATWEMQRQPRALGGREYHLDPVEFKVLLMSASAGSVLGKGCLAEADSSVVRWDVAVGPQARPPYGTISGLS
jgi:hypothetical protein